MSLLENIDDSPAGDKFPDMYAKLNALIDVVNAALGGGVAGQSIRKIDGTDFNFELYTPFTSTTKFKVVNIGAWDITSGLTRSVAHGLTFAKIMGICSVTILDDSLSDGKPISYVNNTYALGGGRYGYDTSNVNLEIRSGGIFDTSSYNSTGANRGYILIAYID